MSYVVLGLKLRSQDVSFFQCSNIYCLPFALHSKPTLPQRSMNTEKKDNKSYQICDEYFPHKILQDI